MYPQEEKGAKSSPRQQHKNAVEIMIPPFGTSGWKYSEILKEIKSAGYMKGLQTIGLPYSPTAPWNKGAVGKNTIRAAIAARKKT